MQYCCKLSFCGYTTIKALLGYTWNTWYRKSGSCQRNPNHIQIITMEKSLELRAVWLLLQLETLLKHPGSAYTHRLCDFCLCKIILFGKGTLHKLGFSPCLSCISALQSFIVISNTWGFIVAVLISILVISFIILVNGKVCWSSIGRARVLRMVTSMFQ